MHQTAAGRAAFGHEHSFLGRDHAANARRTLAVVVVTALAMVVEIAAGLAFGSMALLADGFHMATHAGAIAVAAVAYRIAARRAQDPRLAMGAGKVGDLAGFANAIVLGLVALAIGWESIARLTAPQPVAYAEAMTVATLGLAVNVICALMLGGGTEGHGHGDAHHDHGHHHGHSHAQHGHSHGHVDHNLRGAYLHVLADALTSVVAIVGLGAGWALGWTWMDPAVGALGAVMIASWSISLARRTAGALVDEPPDAALERAIRTRLETGDVVVTDLHLWRVGPGHIAAIIALVSHEPLEPQLYKDRLASLSELSHVTVEVNRCPGEASAAA